MAKVKHDRDRPPKCGPYAVPVWIEAEQRWQRQLTAEGQAYLAERYAKHGNNSGLFATQNRAMYHLARQCGMTDRDIDAACALGTVTALTLFDPGYGWKFETYLGRALQSAVRDAIKAWAMTTSRGEPKCVVARSLVRHYRHDAESVDHLEKRPDPRTTGDDAAEVADLVRHLLETAEIPARDRWIIEERYGLNGQPERTLREIGKRYRMTHERVRQIELAVLNRLRLELADLVA